MAAIELITVQATAPGTGAPFTAVAGNSLTIRDSSKPAWLIALWQQRQVTGFTRILSPLLHDAVVGMGGVGAVGHTWLFEGWQRLYAQDTLVVNGTGSAVAGDLESAHFLVYYEDLPGSSQRLITYDELWRRGEDVYTFANTLATGTAGGYSGSELISAEEDQLKANRDYAWLGQTSSVGASAVRMTGTDFGNLGVGMPAPNVVDNIPAGYQASRFWADLSRRLEWPLIPVINSSNKSNTFLEAVANENGADPILKTHFVLLAPAGASKAKK